ncbi:hypothetical protein LTR62_001574 [Meristemomyces frigidus]|uniref:Uncharacterized protein n=1 Tax=Meristemomyces frigidus TaxID=1508187 RepID=A0AAN7YMC4_9PEZI|nr:hypothetical protein LTR62_001574 [Meristemomyces frigidus]
MENRMAASDGEGKAQSIDDIAASGVEHKSTILNGKQSGAYISPSDSILSPASQKLSSFKQRQISREENGKKSTSRLPFSKTPSTSSGGDDDVAEDDEKTTGS